MRPLQIQIIKPKVIRASYVFLATFGLVGVLSAQPYVPPASHRADVILDSNWRFIRQDVSGAQTNGFDDSSWTNLNLPHTWNNLDGEDGGNNYYRGIGWYRTHLTPDGSYTNRESFLKFDGAFSVADVWVNGNYLANIRVASRRLCLMSRPILSWERTISSRSK